jgi:nucleoside diphosphate kinase
MNNEFGIIILKPDGNKKGVYDKLKNKISENKLEIVKEKRLSLPKQIILEKFTSPFDMNIYSDYLSSGEVTAFLVKGNMAALNLRKLKIDFRKEYGYTSKDMENLVHSIDPGNEYFAQFPVFFPELDVLEYSFCADLTIEVDCDEKEVLKRLENLEHKSNLKFVGIVDKVENRNNVLKKFHYSDRELRTFLGLSKQFSFENKDIEIIGYLPEKIKSSPDIPREVLTGTIEDYFKWIKSNKGVCILGYLPYHEHSSDFLYKLKKLGLSGVIVYDQRNSLYEAEELEDIVCDLELACLGGSGKSCNWGELSIGEYEFLECFKVLLDLERDSMPTIY